MSTELLKEVKSLANSVATLNKSIAEYKTENETLRTEVATHKKALEKIPAFNAEGRLAAVPRDHKEEGKWGFDNFGDFAKEIQKSGNKLATATPRITKSFGSDFVIKAATGMGELVGSDGGFLVPPTFSNTLFERVYKENDLLKRTDQYTVTGNSIVFPRNAESSRANGSRWGGVRAYWLQEGSTITQSRPTFGRLTLTLHKLACLAAITSELMEDSSGVALSQYLGRVFPNEISFLVGDSLISGNGAGMPLGILNAPCTVSVTRAGAGHIASQDIVKMWARLFRGMGSGENPGAVWFVNQDTSPDILLMTLGIGTAGIATYMPPGGLSGKSYGTILGAPVVEVEWCSTLGTVGDIILADMSAMVSVSKGSMDTVNSMHLYFDSDQQAFRTTFRLDAQPWPATALTPFKGSNTQSPFVTLAT